MKIDTAEATTRFRSEAAMAKIGPLNDEWVRKIEEFSRLCEEGVSKTHIAFLGTAILAKAIDRNADLFAVKPKHAQGNDNSFSARVLAHRVLVPLSAELGISLGVSGREPLNNQPYFRMTRLDDGTPVHPGGKKAFDYMVGLVKELRDLPDEVSAHPALRAYIAVRSRYQTAYAERGESSKITPAQLTIAVNAFVRDNSEGGKRAQAVVAGLLDVFAGIERVASGRINDPSRRYPGDVCVRSASDPTVWDKAIEVRDKPVAASDVHIFGRKCVEMNVREAALVMAAERQPQLENDVLTEWASAFGIGLTLFYGWESFVEQVLFWAAIPKPDAAIQAVGFIHERLVGVEVKPESVELWVSLTEK